MRRRSLLSRSPGIRLIPLSLLVVCLTIASLASTRAAAGDPRAGASAAPAGICDCEIDRITGDVTVDKCGEHDCILFTETELATFADGECDTGVCSADSCRPEKNSVKVEVNTACGPNDCCTGGLFDVDVVPSPGSVGQIYWYGGTIPTSVTYVVGDAQIACDGWRFEYIDVVCTDSEETVAFYDYNAVCSDCAANPN